MGEPEVWIESKRIKVLRGPRVGRSADIAIAVVAPVLALFVPGLVGLPLHGAGWIAYLCALIVAIASFLQRGALAQGKGAIGVTGDEVVIVQGHKRRPIPLADLVDGRSSPRRGEVELGLRNGGRIVAAVDDGDDAERLLVAAGLDASKRTMRFELGETTFLTWMTFLLGPSLVLPAAVALAALTPWPWIAGLALYPAFFVLLFYLVRAAWGPAKLIVGADGIVIDRALRDEFVPYDRLVSVSMKPDVVVLLLRNGTRVRARARHLTDVQRGELQARIDAGIAAYHRGENEAEALSQLDRGGRAIAAWRASLHALLGRQGTYRDTPLTREQLLAVLESPAAPAERRLAAAVSLSAAGEAEIATRIRVAAEACARPKVRIALAGVAGGAVDDDALEAAIAEDEASMSREDSPRKIA